MKKYQNFLSENFPFLVVKFSIYLNRRVFVMTYVSLNLGVNWIPTTYVCMEIKKNILPEDLIRWSIRQ